MADDTEAPRRGNGTVSFKRKVDVRQYENAEAFIAVGFDFDPLVGVENPESLMSQAKAAFYDAKAIVFEELGIDFEIVNGIVVEKLVEKHFGAVTEVTQQSQGGNQRQQSNGGGQRQQQSQQQGRSCPDCNGGMWDNRQKKQNGQFSAKSPDFVCKDKEGCGKAVWLQKGNNNGGGGGQRQQQQSQGSYDEEPF